jgi:hypothetical protein
MHLDSDTSLSEVSTQSSSSILDQVASDIAEYCSHYTNERYALRLLAKKMEMSEKTVQRLKDKKTAPSYSTLFRLYVTLTDAQSRAELLTKVPPAVGAELARKQARDDDFQSDLPKFDFLSAIEKQPVLGELYVLVSIREMHKNEVMLGYGQFGLDLLEQLVSAGLVNKLTNYVYASSGRGPVFDGHVIRCMGGHFIERYSKPEDSKVRGNNSLSFYANRLSEEGYKKWLSIDEEAFYKKVEVAKQLDFQGDILAFTFGTTDTLDPNRGDT